MWTISKIRHFINNSPHTTIVYTDHSATVSIVKQINLSSSSVDKLNLWLIRASQYLLQFRLDVRHKPGKQHIVPDAWSWLISDLVVEKGLPTSEEGTLDKVFAFNDLSKCLLSSETDCRHPIPQTRTGQTFWRCWRRMHLLLASDFISTMASSTSRTLLAEWGFAYLRSLRRKSFIKLMIKMPTLASIGHTKS